MISEKRIDLGHLAGPEYVWRAEAGEGERDSIVLDGTNSVSYIKQVEKRSNLSFVFSEGVVCSSYTVYSVLNLWCT